MFEIRLAESQAELEALYRFRYSIYIEEMNRIQHDADHGRKCIKDVLDDTGYNLVAYRKGELVGCVRINFPRDGSIHYYSEFYRMYEQPGVDTDNASIITRLMVSPTARQTTLTFRLFLTCYEFGMMRGIRYNFIDCNDHLVKLFNSFGYRHYIGTAFHKEYGEVHPMLLNLHDEQLFRKLGSPFLKPFLSWKESVNTGDNCVDSDYGRQTTVINTY